MPEGVTFEDGGVWVQRLTPTPDGPPRAALFLDRDGVIVEDEHYLHDPEKVRLTPNAGAIVKRANAAGIAVVVVTNQAGIGYGYFGWDDFIAVQMRIIESLKDGWGAHFDAVIACPFHAKAKPPFTATDHPARKPGPAMLLKARRLLNLDLSASWIVGDRAIDMIAGRNAGLAGGVHVLSGHGGAPGEREKALSCARKDFVVFGANTLDGAQELIPLIRT